MRSLLQILIALVVISCLSGCKKGGKSLNDSSSASSKGENADDSYLELDNSYGDSGGASAGGGSANSIGLD